MEITTKHQTVSLGTANTATTLTNLFTMLAVERLGGRASVDDITEELRRFGIEFKGETIKKRTVEPATELFDLSDDGDVSLKEFGAGLQLRFLLKAIDALDIRNHRQVPHRMFDFGQHKVSKCTWTPSGFTAEVRERKVRFIKTKRPSDDKQGLLLPESDLNSEKNEAPNSSDARAPEPTSHE